MYPEINRGHARSSHPFLLLPFLTAGVALEARALARLVTADRRGEGVRNHRKEIEFVE